jgi:hypothetical protein
MTTNELPCRSANGRIDPAPWEDIPGLVTAFEGCTLPKTRWTHSAHLTVAHHYLWHHSREEATRRMRGSIQRYNASQDNPTGYHETITLGWLAILARELGCRRARDGRTQGRSSPYARLRRPVQIETFCSSTTRANG